MPHALRRTKFLPHLLMMSLGVLSWLAASPTTAADDIEGHCVANCGDGGGGYGGGWRGGGSNTYTAPTAPTPKQRAYDANQRGVASYNAGQYGDALAAFQEALALDPSDPAIQQNARNAEEQVRRAQEEASKAADRQRKEAASHAAIQAGINRLTSSLRAQSAEVNFDGRTSGAAAGGLDFMTSAAPAPSVSSNYSTATPPAPQSLMDASVVDLRDKTDLTVHLDTVKGPTPPAASLGVMGLHDAAAQAPPSSAISSTTEMDTMVNFALGLPFDHAQFLQIPQEQMQQFIDNIQKDPTAFNNAILRKELEAADRAGEPSPYVELEILSRDPKLHQQVKAVRDRVRTQQLKACFAANHQLAEDGQRAIERITRQLGYVDNTDYRVLEADARYQHAVKQAMESVWRKHDEAQLRAQASAEHELNAAAKQLRGKTSLDVSAETRKLRQEYLHLHQVLEHETPNP